MQLARIAAVCCLSMISAFAVSSPAAAQFGPGQGRNAPPSGESLVQSQVMADTARIEPGQTFHLAVVFTIDPHWHIYWTFPGSSGMKTHIDIDAPEGFEVGDIKWPRPQRFGHDGTWDYGYENQVILFVPVTAPAELAAETHRFEVDASWLVCKEACFMGSRKQTISISGSGEVNDARKALLQRYLDRIPKPIDDLDDASVAFDGSMLRITGPAGEFESIEFFPIEMPGVTFNTPDVTIADGRYTLNVRVALNASNAMGREMAVKGVIGLGKSLSDPCYSFEIKPPSS